MKTGLTHEEPTAELEAAVLERGWEKMDEQHPDQDLQIAWGARSDIGRARENNEDKFDFFVPDDPATLARKGRLWAVADGMGGHNAGQIASETALKAIVRAYFADPGEDVAEALRAALSDANRLIFEAAAQVRDRSGMGTTVTAAVVRGDVLTIAHVGDSRAYLLRNREMRQITQDHSWVEEQVKMGSLTRAEAEKSPYRSMITRSIGMGETVNVDIFTENLRPGDVVLLCSDGLTGYLDGRALSRRLEEASPSAAALALIDAANEAGGRDNITAVVLAIRGTQPAAGSAPHGRNKARSGR